jgi:glycosyltransferase involved in cell wall biosynthesis
MSTRPLRILMVTCEWPREGWGGTAHFIVRQAEFLRRAGVDVDVLEFVGGKMPHRYARAWLEVRRRVRRSHYDAIHAQFGQSGLVALPAARPLVVTYRGDDVEGELSDDRGKHTVLGRVMPTLSRFVARRADAVIVVSAHLGKLLQPLTAPVHVIPSGLNFELFRPVPQAEARQALNLPSDKRLVLFVGNPNLARKRFALAQAAVDRLNERLPAQMVVGWKVPHAQIPLFMNAADALVFTSLQEGSPNAVKESLACDLPVVSVPVGDVADRLAGVEGCELCPDDRVETIAAALEHVLRRGGRSNGRAAVAQLDERLLTQRVIGVYHSAAAAWERRRAKAPATAREVDG